MPDSPSNQIIERIDQAAGLYHRLVMLVAPAGAGKTAVLQEVRERMSATPAGLLNGDNQLTDTNMGRGRLYRRWKAGTGWETERRWNVGTRFRLQLDQASAYRHPSGQNMISPRRKVHIYSRVAHFGAAALIQLSGKKVGHLP